MILIWLLMSFFACFSWSKICFPSAASFSGFRLVSVSAAAPFSPSYTKTCKSLVQPCCSLLRQWNNLFSAWGSSFCMAIWAAGLRPRVVLIEAMDHVQRLILRSQKGWRKKTLTVFWSPQPSWKSKEGTKYIHGAACQGDLYHSRRIHWLQWILKILKAVLKNPKTSDGSRWKSSLLSNSFKCT